MDFESKVKAVIVGHAIGDALGVPVEFMSREELKEKPVVDMQGFGTYPVPMGAWSDDTSMSLCALDAMNGKKLNFDKVMVNFGRWYYKGLYTPTGEVFDVGNTCSIAIDNYFIRNDGWAECGIVHEDSNGNGSLMRINPFVLYTYKLHTDIERKIHIIEMASGLTHAHKRSKMACGIYAFILWALLKKPDKKSVLIGLNKAKDYYKNCEELNYYNRLFSQTFNETKQEDIKSGGYVVDSLEASIWCLLTTSNYKECVLKAVNLGKDTDTIAAIAGGLAGALYGYDAIPEDWLNSLIKRNYIEELCKKAFGK